MDKKMTQRIIGVLVVVALVIIVLPLVINSMPASTSLSQTAEVKAPPFPELQNEPNPAPTTVFENNTAESPEATTVAANDTNLPPSKTGSMLKRMVSPEKYQALKAALTSLVASATPQSTQQKTNTPAPAVVAKAAVPTETNTEVETQIFPSTPVITTALEAKEELDNVQAQAMNSAPTSEQSDAMAVAHKDSKSKGSESVLVVNSEGAIVQVPQQRHAQTVATAVSVNNTPKATQTASMDEPVKAIKSPTPRVITAKARRTPTSMPAADETINLSQLKKNGWAVQVASFRNKGNALRLTHLLRAKGYKAFTHEAKNKLTVVYVGPELKQASASTLVSRIHREINMRGVVVNYKGLTV